MTASLQRKLSLDGYLTLSGFVKYLKEYAPHASVSYPTALNLVRAGKLRATRVGAQYRVSQIEVERWVAEGNWIVGLPLSSITHIDY